MTRLRPRCKPPPQAPWRLATAACQKEVDPNKPLIFTLLYRPNIEGLAARGALDSLAVKEAVSKKLGSWPPLGIKPGRFLPGALHREVLTGQLGFTEESVREWNKGKGQGKGGK